MTLTFQGLTIQKRQPWCPEKKWIQRQQTETAKSMGRISALNVNWYIKKCPCGKALLKRLGLSFKLFSTIDPAGHTLGLINTLPQPRKCSLVRVGMGDPLATSSLGFHFSRASLPWTPAGQTAPGLCCVVRCSQHLWQRPRGPAAAHEHSPACGRLPEQRGSLCDPAPALHRCPTGTQKWVGSAQKEENPHSLSQEAKGKKEKSLTTRGTTLCPGHPEIWAENEDMGFLIGQIHL